MRDTINVAGAIYLYSIFRCWRKVAALMRRSNGMRYATDAVQKAVRLHDRGER